MLAEGWLASKGATNIRRERGAGADEARITGTVNGQPTVVEVKADGSATAFTDLGPAPANWDGIAQDYDCGSCQTADESGDLPATPVRRSSGSTG